MAFFSVSLCLDGCFFVLSELVFTRFDGAIGGCLDVFVQRDGADAVRHDASRCGILNVSDGAAYVGVERGVFESPVARGVEGAVFQHQIVRVAQGLFARDVAIDQTQIPGVPAQVFSVQFRVVDGHVLHFPKGVLGGYLGVVYLYVLHVLEYVLAIAFQAIHVDVLAKHEGVGALVQFQAFHADAVTTPKDFVGIVHLYILYVDVVHFAKHLRGVYHCVAHRQVV